MNNNKLTLPTEYSSSGYKFYILEYSQLPLTKDAKLQRVKAIYVAQDTDKISNIEVLILKEGKFHPMSEEFRSNPEGTKLHLPSSSEWGTLGWSFRDIEKARDKYNKIEK